MAEPIPRLLAAGYRYYDRLADAAERSATPGYSLGMEVVEAEPAPGYWADYCRRCGDPGGCDCAVMSGPWCFTCDGPIAEDWSCGC